MKYAYQAPRPLHCPVCRTGRVIDLAAGMDASRVMLCAPQNARNAQFFSKCPKCKLQIGIALKVS